MSQRSDDVYLLEQVTKEFQGPAERLIILRNLNLRVAAGDSLAIVGASGSGKSTLLHLMGSLDEPTSGRVLFHGQELASLSPAQKAGLRNAEIGFVFQFHHLLPEFSTLENVGMPAMIAGRPRAEALAMAAEALELVGLSGRKEYKVTTLSGGERQRAAIARAILLRPKVLLADEPTGNLDAVTGAAVGELLLHLNTDIGMTLVLVTHNSDLAGLMRRRCELRAGELYE